MARQLVAVIIPVYNGERYVAEALESAFAQRHGPLEVIVVNDGSTDASESVIAPYRNRITYIRQPNLGIAGAYNTGIARCSGDFVCFLEQDDVWLPDKIGQELEALRSRPRVGMVYSRYYLGDEAARIDARAVSQLEFEGRCFADFFAATLEGPTVLPFSSVCIRRAVLDAIGPLDTGLRVSVDYSLWLKISYRYDIARVEEPGLIYRQHGGNTSRNTYGALRDDATIIEQWAACKEATRLLGKSAVRRRLRNIYDALSWACRSSGRHDEERQWCLKLARISRYSLRDWARYGSTLLPFHLRRRCDWYWSRLCRVPRRNRGPDAG